MTLKRIGLTDYYFKELVKSRPDYLLFLINNICNLNLKLEDIKFEDVEERDSITFKTISYDIKIISGDVSIDVEAQKNIVNNEKNENGEYTYDINRAIYYLTMLHSASYRYKEAGYVNKKSFVIFIFNYDIPGNDSIQRINLHNNSTNVEYDDLNIYFVSLEKINTNSKIELERALKLLSDKDITKYEKDKSEIIKEAALMLKGYDESERAIIMEMNRKREDFERRHQLHFAEEKGKAEGASENLVNNIKTMHSNGFDAETIAKALSLDIEFVKDALNK